MSARDRGQLAIEGGDTVDEPPLLYGEWGLVQLTNPSFAKPSGGLFGLGVFIIIDDDP